MGTADDVRADHDPAQLRAWLTGCVAELLQVDPNGLGADRPLADFGLDSVTALSVGAEIEDHFGVTLDPNALWENPSVADLALLLGELLMPERTA